MPCFAKKKKKKKKKTKKPPPQIIKKKKKKKYNLKKKKKKKGYDSQDDRGSGDDVGDVVGDEEGEVDERQAAIDAPRRLAIDLVLLEVVSHSLAKGIVQGALSGIPK